MPHKKGKGKTWRKVEVDNKKHFGKILDVRCCCEGEKIIGAGVVSMNSMLDYYGGVLAIKMHA